MSGTLSIWRNNLSKIVLLLCCAFIVGQRFSNVTEKEISWDVLGYYTYLPATIIHDDFLLEDVSWLKKEVSERDLAGTLYFISENSEGKPMYFFMMGMALFFLPWFLIGHAIALGFDFPSTGFSPPYVYALITGALVYTIAGAFVLRKILKKFFEDQLVALILIIIYLGTNTVHHLIAKDLETVNVLFLLSTIVIWNTLKWHETFRIKNLFAIGVSIGLMILVKPSEILIGLFPLLYGVTSMSSLKEKALLIVRHRISFLATIAIGVLILLPQLLYWHLLTGQFIYDSYNNPGVGLDWTTPYVTEVLFSFKKGWFIYTPVMILSLIGFICMYRKNKKLFWPSVIYFLLSFYLMSSWTEWWYGSSYSCRPIITLYPLLAISLGYFIKSLASAKQGVKYGSLMFVGLCIVLNQFQWWQFRSYIFHDFRMTKEYYQKVFLKTTVSTEDRKLLDYEPDFSGAVGMIEEFKRKDWLTINFSNPPVQINSEKIKRVNNEAVFFIDSLDLWTFDLEHKVSDITSAKHFFLEYKITYRYSSDVPEKGFPVLFSLVRRANGTYGSRGFDLKAAKRGEWITESFNYSAPPIRNQNDFVISHIWNPSHSRIEIKNLQVDVYEWERSLD
mgnify:CR=1 FL=1